MQWLAVLLMGWVLGALGGGGGILTVPILVGLFGMTATAATGSSLFIVGSTSAIGAMQGLWKGQSEWRAAVGLAIPSTIGAFAARRWIVPSIPKSIAGVPKDDVLLGAFALLMVIVGVRMLRPAAVEARTDAGIVKIAAIGLLIGVVSGLLGAGGGFLILPVLTLFLGVPMQRAVPTSLLVITIQALGGFTGELGKPIEWRTLGTIIAVAIAGLLIGLQMRGRASQQTLKVGFSMLVFAVAAWIIIKIAMNHFAA